MQGLGVGPRQEGQHPSAEAIAPSMFGHNLRRHDPWSVLTTWTVTSPWIKHWPWTAI